MTATILLTHLPGGSLAGRSATFDKELVRLGRQTDNDVVYDPKQDLLVSGRHAEVRAEGDALLVRDAGSRNGTYVNGRRIDRATRIGPGDRVALGARGPTFTARLGHGASTASPVGVGMNTLMGAISKVTHRERRRTTHIVGGVVALAGLLMLGLWSRIEAARAVDAPAGDFTEVFAQVEPAVYVVIVRDANGSATTERGFGTAWSVERGKLATNAHVARAFDELEPGQSLVARSSSEPPHDLRIAGIEVHPGYDRFQEQFARYNPFHHTEGSFLSVSPACDVALLEIDERDHDAQAAPIPLADDESLATLDNGAPVAYVGFPAEGISAGGTLLDRPTATSIPGTLSKQTDVFLGRAERPDDAIALTYYMQTAGGGSGSPVVDAAGHAIGLLAAINVAGVGQNGHKVARIAAGGTSYGPRVDVLRELLDGSVKEKQPPRQERWEARLLELFRQGVANPEKLALRIAMDELPATAEKLGVGYKKLEVTEVARHTLRAGGTRDAIDTVVHLPTSGVYLLVAVAIDHPTKLGSTVRVSGDRPGEYAPSTYYTGTTLMMRGRGTTTISVHADPDDANPKTEFAVVLVQGVR